MEQLLLRCGDAVVVVDGVGQFGEAVFESVESLVIVRLSGGVLAELQTIQRNAQWAERKEDICLRMKRVGILSQSQHIVFFFFYLLNRVSPIFM